MLSFIELQKKIDDLITNYHSNIEKIKSTDACDFYLMQIEHLIGDYLTLKANIRGNSFMEFWIGQSDTPFISFWAAFRSDNEFFKKLALLQEIVTKLNSKYPDVNVKKEVADDYKERCKFLSIKINYLIFLSEQIECFYQKLTNPLANINENIISSYEQFLEECEKRLDQEGFTDDEYEKIQEKLHSENKSLTNKENAYVTLDLLVNKLENNCKNTITNLLGDDFISYHKLWDGKISAPTIPDAPAVLSFSLNSRIWIDHTLSKCESQNLGSKLTFPALVDTLNPFKLIIIKELSTSYRKIILEKTNNPGEPLQTYLSFIHIIAESLEYMMSILIQANKLYHQKDYKDLKNLQKNLASSCPLNLSSSSRVIINIIWKIIDAEAIKIENSKKETTSFFSKRKRDDFSVFDFSAVTAEIEKISARLNNNQISLNVEDFEQMIPVLITQMINLREVFQKIIDKMLDETESQEGIAVFINLINLNVNNTTKELALILSDLKNIGTIIQKHLQNEQTAGVHQKCDVTLCQLLNNLDNFSASIEEINFSMNMCQKIIDGYKKRNEDEINQQIQIIKNFMKSETETKFEVTSNKNNSISDILEKLIVHANTAAQKLAGASSLMSFNSLP